MLNITSDTKILAIGAHADDIELGSGATLIKYITETSPLIHHCVLSTEIGHFNRMEEASKATELIGIPKENCIFAHFKDKHFPEQRIAIHEFLENMKNLIQPNIVIAHSCNDCHQDHIETAETIKRIFREGQTILSYEINQYHKENFNPNLFIDVSKYAKDKYTKIHKSFPSQLNKTYLQEENIMATMILRAQQCGNNTTFAEAFESRISVI